MSHSEPGTRSAEIILFPLKPVPVEVPEDGNERLRRALLALDAAIAGQREAVAAWRGALGELRTVMSGLGTSMQRYHGSLESLSERVGALNSQARQLERTADAALASVPR